MLTFKKKSLRQRLEEIKENKKDIKILEELETESIKRPYELRDGYFYIGRCPNDFDTVSGKMYTKSGITGNPKGRKSNYDTNSHEGFRYHFIILITNRPREYLEKVEQLFHEYETKDLKGENVVGVVSAGTEIRFATPEILFERFDKMCKILGIKYTLVDYETVTKINKKKENKIKKEQKIMKLERMKKTYTLREHQEICVKKVIGSLGETDRGQIIHPTGTGKTIIIMELIRRFLEIKEKREEKCRVIIFCPTLDIIQQLYENVRSYLSQDICILILASRLNIITDDGKIHANVGVNTIIECSEKYNKMIVISTYASCHKLLNKELMFEYAFYDEAHRTVGDDKAIKAMITKDENVLIGNRFYFTATRRFCDSKTGKVISMDDEFDYGPIIDFISLRDAIKRELLTDFCTINMYSDVKEVNNINHTIASIRQAFLQYQMKKMIVYAKSRAEAKQIEEGLKKNFSEQKDDDIDLNDTKIFYVDGNTKDREDIYNYYRDPELANIRSIICSIDVLREGVDLPFADCVCFACPKNSGLPIIQIIGRILRKVEGKYMAYLLIPSIDKDTTMITAVYEALQIYDELDLRIKEKGQKGALKIDDIIGELGLISQQIDGGTGKLIDKYELQYNLEEVTKSINSMICIVKPSKLISKTHEVILEIGERIADGERIFKKKEIDGLMEELKKKCPTSFNGKTPQNTLSRMLQDMRDKGLLQFEPRGNKGEYKIL